MKRGCRLFERAPSASSLNADAIINPDLIIVGDYEDWPTQRIRAIRRMYPTAKIILCNSDSEQNEIDIDLVLSRGFDGYISDKTDEPRIVSLLQNLLAGKCALPRTAPSLRRGWGAAPVKTADDPFHAS